MKLLILHKNVLYYSQNEPVAFPRAGRGPHRANAGEKRGALPKNVFLHRGGTHSPPEY